MSQVDSVCIKKTCLSHLYKTAVYDKHTVEQLHMEKVIIFESCHVLSLNSTYNYDWKYKEGLTLTGHNINLRL